MHDGSINLTLSSLDIKLLLCVRDNGLHRLLNALHGLIDFVASGHNRVIDLSLHVLKLLDLLADLGLHVVN